MPLKFKYSKKEEIPAEQLPLYAARKVQANGAEVEIWFLDCEGAVDQDRFVEFRNNNIALNQKVADLTKLFEGIDPEEARKLIAIKGDLDASKIVKSGDLDKAVELRTQAMKTEFAKTSDTLTKQNQTLMARLQEVEINQATVECATKKGLKPTAMLDITYRARNKFTLVDGKVIALGPDGKTPIYGKDAVTPLTIEEWVESQVAEAPHLFEASKGSGASGSGSGGAGNVTVNPWKSETFNLTEQMRIYKADPALGDRLKAAAGKK